MKLLPIFTVLLLALGGARAARSLLKDEGAPLVEESFCNGKENSRYAVPGKCQVGRKCGVLAVPPAGCWQALSLPVEVWRSAGMLNCEVMHLRRLSAAAAAAAPPPYATRGRWPSRLPHTAHAHQCITLCRPPCYWKRHSCCSRASPVPGPAGQHRNAPSRSAGPSPR